MKNKIEKNEGVASATSCSALGNALDQYQADFLPICYVCGVSPHESLPRVATDKAGEVTVCMCRSCGWAHSGSSLKSALERWNSEVRPNLRVMTPRRRFSLHNAEARHAAKDSD